MEKVQKSVDNFVNLMDTNNRGVQITCYSVALLGLTVALRKVRPFSRFRSPSDIPDNFLKEKRELLGHVKRIDPNGGLLIIEHKPLITIPLLSSGDLPVKISGINVSGLGNNWLQSIIVDREVKFIPISKGKDFVQCQVLLLQTNQNDKQEIINIGESLVKIGFAFPEKIGKPLSEDPVFLKYYYLLLKAEQYALRKQLGYKYYIIPTKKVLTYCNERLMTIYAQARNYLLTLVYKTTKLDQS